MARASWPKAEARRIQKRLDDVVKAQFGEGRGAQAAFYKKCGFTRDTTAKWRGTSARTPDTLALAIIGQKCGVSLDWLVLGRGSMDWPQPATHDAKEQLYQAVWGSLEKKSLRQQMLEDQGFGADDLWEEMLAYGHRFAQAQTDPQLGF